MTEQEFKQKREQIQRRINLMHRQILAIEQEFVGTLPFKPGDAISMDGRFIGWLVSISASIYQWDVKYNPPKKDGSRSNKVQIHNCQLASINHFNKTNNDKT